MRQRRRACRGFGGQMRKTLLLNGICVVKFWMRGDVGCGCGVTGFLTIMPNRGRVKFATDDGEIQEEN
jgi:hypothetical protein